MEATLDPEALRRAREAAGLTQNELARLIGVAGGERVSSWERGVSRPRATAMGRIAEVLGVPTTSLMTGSTDLGLRAMRTLAGLSAAEVAQQLGISAATLTRWEAGRFSRIPGSLKVRCLAQALGRSVQEVEQAFARGTSHTES